MHTYDHKIYYEPQRDWTPKDFYALWRYLNRLFLNVRDKKTAEIAALDLTRMTDESRYLIKHLLILQGRYTSYLAIYPNLAGLRAVGELGHPLHLAEKPLYAHPYFTEVGIYL